MKKYIPFVFILGGCGLMEYMGMATPEGDPTLLAEGASVLVEGLTGIELLALWKAGEALLTGRGRDNLRNVFSGTGAKSTFLSLLSLMVGTHSPPDAVVEEPSDG